MSYELYLEHHGILGQKWGIRRYQNEDGSLTSVGRARYGGNLDINDTTKGNIAKIRTGEARRKYDEARGSGASKSQIRLAKADLKKAKQNQKMVERAEKGEARYKQGKIIDDEWKAIGLSTVGFSLAQKALSTFGPTILSQAHFDIKKANNIINNGLGLMRVANLMVASKHAINIKNMRTYNRALTSGSYSKQSVGGKEYRDVVERRKGSR